MQISVGISTTRPALAVGGGAPAAVISSINGAGYGNGWSAEWVGTPPTFAPDSAPVTISVSRQGYDATGATTTYTDNRTFTQRVRQAYPNQASLTAATVALDDYVYSTDSITGVTNNSTMASPKPVVNWVLPARVVVGNTLRVEVVAAHRDARGGRELACFKYSITDGSNTVSGTISAESISTNPYDLHPVTVYAADVDISSLNNGSITLNGEAYPWIGDTNSVTRSSTGTANSREFCPRIYLKNPTLLAAPPLAYVDTVNGQDESVTAAGVGVTSGLQKVSTTASAVNTTGPNMFASWASAMNALRLATTITGGFVDGCEIRISNCTATFASSVTSATYNSIAACTITRDPNYARSACIMSYGVANSFTRQAYLRVKDVSILRTGAFMLRSGTAPDENTFENVAVDNNNSDAAIGNNQYVNGATLTGTLRNSMFATVSGTSTGENRLMRGISTTTGASWEVFNAHGCDLTSITAQYSASAAHIPNNNTISSCFLKNGGGANSMLATDGVASSTVTGFAMLNNVFEYTSATSNPAVRPSGDNATLNHVHFLMHHNTLAGTFNNGRGNILYDETVGTGRSHTLQSFKGNLHTSINNKGDVFRTDGTRTGNWGYLYGVGCQGEFSMYIDANNGGLGTSFSQAYGGLGAKLGTSNSVRQDPLFTNFQAWVSGGSPGTGGGTYSVGALSPCKSMVTDEVVSFDFAGNARTTTNGTAGAYA